MRVSVRPGHAIANWHLELGLDWRRRQWAPRRHHGRNGPPQPP